MNAGLHVSQPARGVDARGFTLIELLVVIVIIGVILTMASLSVGVLGRDTEVEDQVRRLHAILTQAREEAELQGRDLGLLIERGGYLFMRYSHTAGQWQILDHDEMLAYRKLPEGLQFRLWLDAREVVLKSHDEGRTSSAIASSSSPAGADNPPSAPLSSTPGAAARPQIAILSSGDILPFELRLSRDGDDFNWRLLGGADNSLNIESGGDPR